MKTNIKMPALIVLTCILSSVFCSCAVTPTTMNKDTYEDFEYVYTDKDAFIVSYTWDGDPDNMEITIPDELHDVPVKAFGGNFGNDGLPFKIIDASKEGIDEFVPVQTNLPYNEMALTTDEIVYYNFKVNIGKNPKVFTYSFWPIDLRIEDGISTAYVYRLYFEVDPNNLYLEARDGVLYDKVDGTKYDKFMYWDEIITN